MVKVFAFGRYGLFLSAEAALVCARNLYVLGSALDTAQYGDSFCARCGGPTLVLHVSRRGVYECEPTTESWQIQRRFLWDRCETEIEVLSSDERRLALIVLAPEAASELRKREHWKEFIVFLHATARNFFVK